MCCASLPNQPGCHLKGKLIATGNTAEVFAWGQDRVLKLFWPEYTPQAEGEFTAARAVHAAGLPAPAAYEVVEVEGRRGIVFERIDGPTMLDVLLARPWRLKRLARTMAELHVRAHSLHSQQPEALRQVLLRALQQDRYLLPPHLREGARRLLEQLPDGSSVLHGDFHPINIIMSGRGPVIIDWPDVTRGDPAADVARTWLLTCQGHIPPGTREGGVIHLLRRLFYRAYLHHYRQLRPLPQETLEAWKIPVVAGRLASEAIPPEEQVMLVKFLERRLRG